MKQPTISPVCRRRRGIDSLMRIALDLDNPFAFRLAFVSFLGQIYDLFKRIPLQQQCWTSISCRERAIYIAELIAWRCWEWGLNSEEKDERAFIAALITELMDLFDMLIGPQNTPKTIAT